MRRPFPFTDTAMRRTHAWIVLCAGLVLAGVSSGQEQNPVPNAEPQAETAGAWRGRVEALIVDNFQTGTSRTRFFLHTSEGPLELQELEGKSLRAGQLVEVRGRMAGKRLAVSQLTAFEAQAATTTCTAVGEQKALVILASFPSKALLSSVTPQLMHDSFFRAGRTVDGFLRESSFGQTWLTGDVVGPFVLDADYFDQPLAARNAAVRAAAAAADLTKYNRIVVVGPQGQMGMASGGMALLGCGPVPSPRGNLNVSSIWLGGETMVAHNTVVAIASHEFGHGFGLMHARWADYGGEALGPAGQPPAPWDSLHDYGDFFSIMGKENSGQWAAPHKALLGWLQAGTNIQTVTANGTFTVPPYELSGSGQALRISRDGSGKDWLWLEYRQPQGTFDSTLPVKGFAGALVHYVDPALQATSSGYDSSTYTNLVNFHPSVAAAQDPTLHTGETWSDPYGNLSLKVNSANAAGMNVSVSYAPASTCPTSAGSAQTFDVTGGKGVVPVTAASACSWSAAASVSWITVGLPGSGTGNGSVSFTVAQNPNVSPRWGKIAIGGAFVIVRQAGAAGSLTISPQTATFSAAGGTGDISVATSAPDFAWAFNRDATWITSVECSSILAIGPATLHYIVAANFGAARTATITVNSLKFTVTQQAGVPVPGSLTWTQLSPKDAPPARTWQAMAPFAHSGQAILYGGAGLSVVFSDTWLWDGSNWTLLHPANNPGPLDEHAMAYDDARGNIVLFGGMRQDNSLSSETWTWDGNNWRQQHPAASPSARYGHAMAYDPVSKTVILFGGTGTRVDTNDTWKWDGANWTQVTTSSSPIARQRHAMAFDAAHGVTVLFGGFSTAANIMLSDTWLYDASGWRQALISSPPRARMKPLLAYHPGLQSVVLTGGTTFYGAPEETWLWNGGVWAQQFPDNQPGAAFTLGAVWDEVKQRLIVHLGDDLACVSRGPKTFLLTGSTAGAPLPLVTSVVNGASFAAGPLAAGSWATVFGSCLGGQKVSVTFDGIVSTLAYAGPKQINLLIPSQLASQSSAQMVVAVDRQQSIPITVSLTATCPGIFTPGILNQDYSVNSASSPAALGSVIQIYMTGLNVPAGWAASADIGNDLGLTPLYAGPAPGLAGLDQVNVLLPPDLSGSRVPVKVCVAQLVGTQKICSPAVDLAIGGGTTSARSEH